MRIHLLSDLHLEFAGFVPADNRADVVVLAGDIHVGIKGILWAQDAFGDTPVIYVAGNHEYYHQTYPDHLARMREAAFGSNVRFLENEATEINGVVFLGCTLWTDFELFGDSQKAMYEADVQMNDYRAIRTSADYQRLRPADTLALHKKSVDWLRQPTNRYEGKKRVFVTHHAPSLRSVPPRYKKDVVSAAFASPLDDLVVSLRATYWLHGHVHQASDYRIGETRVLCNSRGYPNETNIGFDPNHVVEI